MKKTFKFFAAALAIVAAASCAKEISNDDIQAPEQELVHKVFTASFDTDTKTTLADDGLSVHWTEGDAIKVIPADSEYGTNFNIVSFDGTIADFEGETVDANSYRAVYPANALMNGSVGVVFSNKNYFIFASNDTKCALAHQYAVENDFSVIKEFNASSNFALSTSSQDNLLYFKNLNAYLKLCLAMDNAASIEVSASKINSAPYNDDGNQSYKPEAKLGGPIAFDLSRNKRGIVPENGENIVFTKEDGSNLLSGEDNYYYIAIPSVGMYDLQLIVRDAAGNQLQKFVRSGKFTPAANTIYNLGVIEEAEVDPIESLYVSKSYISLAATYAFDFFTISANRNWTINTNQDWLSVDIISGEPDENIQIKVTASDNTSYQSRSATITITGENEVQTINVTQSAAPKPQTYKIVRSVHANEVVNGKKYVVRLQGDENKYWANSDGKLILAGLTNGEIRKENVVVFEYIASTDTKATEYKSVSVGYLKSLVSYFGLDPNMNFSTSASVLLTLANRYGADTGYDIDIRKNESNQFLYCNRTNQPAIHDETTAGWNGNSYRKWYIYEVTEE